MAKERGFTLIELLVVVLIVAILLSAGMMSLRPNDQQRLKIAAQNVQQWLALTCDLALFKQSIVTVIPDQQGLYGLIWQGRVWQRLQTNFSWPEGIQVSWRGVQPAPASLAPLPAEGWLCWPDETRTTGEIILQQASQQQRVSLNESLTSDDATQNAH